MDIALLFVLPLIGGFALVTRFEPLRYRAGRVEAQRLYYDAAACAVFLFAVALALHAALLGWSRYDAGIRWLADELVIPLSYKEPPPTSSGAANAVSSVSARNSVIVQARRAAVVRAEVTAVCVWAVLLGLGARLWNAILAGIDWLWVLAGPRPKRLGFMKRWNRRSITDQLEAQIADAVLFQRTIQLSLSNDKVYVGRVLSAIDPSGPTKHIKIQPVMSGHRNSDDGTVVFNTFYDEATKALPLDRAATFELVVPVEQIVTASGFDFVAYDKFSLQRKTNAEVQSATPAPTALAQIPADSADAQSQPAKPPSS